MTIEQMKQQKKKLGYTAQEIADLSGVPLGTVQKIFSGATKAPRYDTLMKLEQVLRSKLEASVVSETSTFSHGASVSGSDRVPAHGVAEAPAAYGSAARTTNRPSGRSQAARSDPDFDISRQGTFTYSDYIALPVERRVELIDGWFYDMAAPNSKHQIIVGEFYTILRECAKDHSECMVLLSPMDIMLDEDDRTVVQPDVMVLCDLTKMRKGRVFGAPDLVIEVVSPGSVKNDYSRKSGKYMEAGVREYWIVDYKRRTVVVFRNMALGDDPQNNIDRNLHKDPYEDPRDDPEITIYGMDGAIPIAISDGKCSIDVSKIAALLDSLGDI